MWKSLHGYSKYLFSCNGDVKNIKSNKFLNGSIKEYKTIRIYPDDISQKPKNCRLHIIIAQLFCENPDNKDIVDHIDSNKMNNCYTNLRWVTIRENAQFAVEAGLVIPNNKRKVQRINISTKEIKVYDSIQAAYEDNKDIIKYTSSIVHTCSGKQKTSGGFIWKYMEETILHDIPIGKDIEGFENYIITQEGKIFNKKRKHYINPHINKSGYEIIDLHSENYNENVDVSIYTRKRNAKRKKFRVHRLVAMYYIDNPENKKEVNHKDKNRLNNKIDNLEWVTGIENLKHAHNKAIIQCSLSGFFIKFYKIFCRCCEQK